MELKFVILIFVLMPLLAFFITFFIDEKQEKLIANITSFTITLILFGVIGISSFWFFTIGKPLNIKELVLYQNDDYAFVIDFYLDGIAATYLFVGAFISFLIVRYSRYYMHLEQGYRRFFSTILFFYFSYNYTVLAGNFETLFMGWEMLGISSFLLIGFYRERYLPVRNAVKVFSVYRVGDIGILLAMWASHHLWHENITFDKLNNAQLVHEHIAAHSGVGLFIAVCLLVAAAAKSAQFPFCSWIPRAMEGPTPSSAIFYGSLSIHFGVFLLIRTAHFWEQQVVARILIGTVGAITALLGYLIAKTQPTIKTQIAYASVSQIGLMFLEISLGFTTLAMVHFVGNAFLRTYQLLVSPSVVSYLIREQFYHFRPEKEDKKYWLGKRFHYSLYLLSLREFNMDTSMTRFFKFIKKIGSLLNFLTYRNIFLYFLPTYCAGWFLFWNMSQVPHWLEVLFPETFALIALIMILKSFAEHDDPILAWVLVVLGHFWIALAIAHNEKFNITELIWYLGGVSFAGICGQLILWYLKREERGLFDLYRYYGHIYEYPRLAGLFLLCALGLMGFPITTTFIGEDLIFSHIHENELLLAVSLSSSFVVGGIALVRIYARLFLGNHAKVYHETPLQSS